MKLEKIGIIGSGLIGRAWAMLFISVGYQVMLYDILPAQVKSALQEIEKGLKQLEAKGALRGALNAAEQFKCICHTNDLKILANNAMYIQECIPECVELKQQLYRELDSVMPDRTIVASSTSTLMPSLFSEGMKHKANVLASHPINPPYFIPLVEIVPSTWTSPKVTQRTHALMLEIGQKPIVLTCEREGFITNRIQYAILNEVWGLVNDGVISSADVNAVTFGLGLPYAFLESHETETLNVDRWEYYFERFGKRRCAHSMPNIMDDKQIEEAVSSKKLIKISEGLEDYFTSIGREMDEANEAQKSAAARTKKSSTATEVGEEKQEKLPKISKGLSDYFASIGQEIRTRGEIYRPNYDVMKENPAKLTNTADNLDSLLKESRDALNADNNLDGKKKISKISNNLVDYFASIGKEIRTAKESHGGTTSAKAVGDGVDEKPVQWEEDTLEHLKLSNQCSKWEMLKNRLERQKMLNRRKQWEVLKQKLN